jgi:hypothetical protein
LTGRIGVVASATASERGFYPQELPLDDRLLEELEKAEEANTLVIVLVDSWSLMLPAYRQLMLRYDSCGHLNCAAIVVYDDRADTIQHQGDLEVEITRIFDDNMETRYPRLFRFPVEAPESLRQQLVDVLDTLHLNVINKGKRRRPLPQGSLKDSL